MRVLIAGASGTVGSIVVPHLLSRGYEITRLVRREPAAGEVRWDPEALTIDDAGLEGFDGVVHLATMSLQSKWTPGLMRRFRANRLGTNRLLAEALARCRRKPGVLICASGVGFYAPSDEQVLTEESPGGTDFIGQLQRDGEAACGPASAAGIRVVQLRIPTVLAGRVLGQFASMARRGLGRVGNGRQWTSWVSRQDIGAIVHHALVTSALEGPVNPCSPNPVRQADLMAIVGRIVGRRPRWQVPVFLLRWIVGELVDALLLPSRRCIPVKLLATGFQFSVPDVEVALRQALEKAPPVSNWGRRQ